MKCRSPQLLAEAFGFLLRKVRAIISDFAVFITILTMVLVDYGLGIPSPKLQVPSKFKVSPSLLFYNLPFSATTAITFE